MAITTILRLRLDLIAGGSVTLYIGNEPTQRANGGTVEAIPARLINCSHPRALGDLKRSRQQPAPLSIEIDNNDGFYDAYLPGGALVKTWDRATASLVIGGTVATDIGTAIPLFNGLIQNGSWAMREGIISFVATPLQFDNPSKIGGQKIAIGTNAGIVKPYRIGDFTTAEIVGANALSCIYESGSTWIISDTPIAAPFRCWRQAGGVGAFVEVTGSAVFNAAAGKVDLSAVAGIAPGDVITASCKCTPPNWDFLSNLTSFHPVDVLKWLMTFGNNPTLIATYIDAGTFTQAKADGEPITVRRDLQAESTWTNEAERLAFETSYTMLLTPQSKIAIYYNLPKTANALTLQLGKYDFEENTFAFSADPDRTYASAIEATFNEYNGEAAGEKSIGDLQLGVLTNVDFAWQYLDSATQRQLERFIYYWQNSPNVVSLSMPFEDANDPRFAVELLDLITLNYRHLVNAPLQVRGLTFDFLIGQIQLQAYQVASLGYASRWGIGGFLFSAVSAGATSAAILNADKQLLPAGYRVYIGTDDNGGPGYFMLTVTPAGITFTPALGSNQPAGAPVRISPLELDQSPIVGIWGAPTDTVYI